MHGKDNTDTLTSQWGMCAAQVEQEMGCLSEEKWGNGASEDGLVGHQDPRAWRQRHPESMVGGARSASLCSGEGSLLMISPSG
jgi:hypothetical protein